MKILASFLYLGAFLAWVLLLAQSRPLGEAILIGLAFAAIIELANLVRYQ